MLNRINISVFIIAALGTALSFSIYFWQNQVQQKLIQEKFKAQIEKKTYEIKEGLELNMHALNSLAAFYYGSNSIGHDEFHEYTSVMLEMHPSIHSLQWLVKVPHELKEKFYIFEFDSNGSKRSVQERKEYYPILYAEPLEQNEIVIGLDVGFKENRRDAIVKSIETASASMSAQINLIESKKGVLLFYPIYKDRKTKKDILGFFLAIIEIQELISKTIKDEFFDKGIASITIKEMDGSQEGELLFSKEHDYYISDFYHESKIDFASKSWKIEAYASEYFVQAQFKKYPLILLLLLLGITFILAFAIYLMLKKQEVLIESNDEMRRFQNVAVTREERIAELKKVIKELQEQNGAKNV
ncbi:MAG: CHASE domain-containing protein [Sulfurimonas sp.]|uniref:CHASE domain-containing protein n=1 Tax=Sulfurimonas sp. TaxID=2022749 RepID=UPI0028CCBC26|nr:CHASE domain-containing protein [Sulfurimonas sp.]MDT8338636.1 CHASE domain-containing protein [Sulfurimonas sp.]